MKIEINIQNRHVLIILLFIIAASAIGLVMAYGGTTPSAMGHTWGEMVCDSTLCANSVNGNVGIGTSNPQSKLDVRGVIKVNEGWVPNQEISIGSNQIWKSVASSDPNLYLQYYTEGGGVIIGDNSGAANPLYVYGSEYGRDYVMGGAGLCIGNFSNCKTSFSQFQIEIGCGWTGWQYGGASSCCSSCTCATYTCTRIYCDGSKVTQASTATCYDAYYYSPPYCPFFYSWDGTGYQKDTTFIYKLDSPEKETIQLRELKLLDLSGTIKAKIVEEEKETSYIDRIQLVIVDAKGSEETRYELNSVYASDGLDRISASDNIYLVMNQGDEISLEFEQAPALENGWTRQVFIKAEGYYQSS